MSWFWKIVEVIIGLGLPRFLFFLCALVGALLGGNVLIIYGLFGVMSLVVLFFGFKHRIVFAIAYSIGAIGQIAWFIAARYLGVI